MGFIVRPAYIACGLSLFPQLLQVAAQDFTCTVAETLSGQADCIDPSAGGTCTAGDVDLPDDDALTNVQATTDLCDGTQDSITFTGDLTFLSTGSGDRQDVGMWLGDFGPGGTCDVYGFKCEEDTFDLESNPTDICADVQQGSTLFAGVQFTDLGTISVTPSLVAEPCLGDGSDFLLTFGNIPTEAEVSYTIAAVDGTFNIPDIAGSPTGNTATETLYPTIAYTITVAVAFENNEPDCGDVTLPLNPTCSESPASFRIVQRRAVHKLRWHGDRSK
ncbi:hypothetical protein Esi_0168_0001 [Ectocarpus siliculosus]|uniref:Uncharacterized protein n=1 Tax=Ectocarpus siliculosus TaxID=2880 RepID=D8LGH7_ECTSI|nr:hypothetical protein Esi_0168_0001 [Ectocarpus siliculosus]|eukprot:CBN79034.1 hypothetical protein Esi_0168_0001 [Ectocarpus siliculosus]